VIAARHDDAEGAGVVLRLGDRDRMLCTSVKLLAEVLDEQGVCDCHWRRWAADAGRRP